MTPEEAKQLKEGDIVLIEAKVRNWNLSFNESPFDETDGSVAIHIKRSSEEYGQITYTHCSAIIDKKAPPRRKFKQGDIVRVDNLFDRAQTVYEDETDGVVKVRYIGRGLFNYDAEELTLVCAVEDRKDNYEETI